MAWANVATLIRAAKLPVFVKFSNLKLPPAEGASATTEVVAAIWLFTAANVATEAVVKPVLVLFTKVVACASSAVSLAAGVVAFRTAGSDKAASSAGKISSSLFWMIVSKSALVIFAPSSALLPTELSSKLDCCCVVTTSMRAIVAAAALYALLLLLKSSNTDTLMPVCA